MSWMYSYRACEQVANAPTFCQASMWESKCEFCKSFRLKCGAKSVKTSYAACVRGPISLVRLRCCAEMLHVVLPDHVLAHILGSSSPQTLDTFVRRCMPLWRVLKP